jgi:hypothetical protein
VLSGGVVKQGVDLETAKKYQQVLQQQGCACAIESEKLSLALDPVEKRPSPAPASSPPKTAAVAATAAAGASNPYAPPASAGATAEPVEDDADLESLAFGQKLVIYTIIANFAWAAIRGAMPPALAGLLALAIVITSLVGVWKISSALGSNIVMKIVAILFMFIPLVNLITLVLLSVRATKRLKDAGYTVGLLGARR